MALFRGTGGSGDASTDTYASEVALEATRASTKANEAAASATSAANAQAAAEAAQASAETAQANAETAEVNAETAETNAETAENAAVDAQTSATAAKTAAETAQSAAEVAKTAAEAAETNAETAETNAATSATTATTKASEASTSATNAASSASSASTSATNAATSATAAQTAQTAAEAAQTAAEAAQEAIDGLYLGTATSNPTVDLNGNAVTVGDWYFNTSDNTTRIYDGSNWNTINPDLVGDTTPQLGGDLASNGNDILFADNDKAIFGAGSDLEVYHDGTDSYIKENNSVGSLVIQGTNVLFKDSLDNDLIRAISGNFVALYHNNVNRFSTLSDGINVTGNITVSGSVDGRDVATDGSKLDNIELNADVTDTANVTAAGALMDSEVTNLAQVKAFDSADYATAAQGSTADSALQNVVEDTTPQLGGNLDLNGNDITGTGNINITGDTTLTGNKSVKLPRDGAGFVDRGIKFHDTLGGTEILADSSDNLTIKSVGHVVVNANDGEIKIKDGGSAFAGQIDLANDNNVTVSALIANKDIIFKGNDHDGISGVSITALTLDMSDAGKALFNAGADFGADISVTGTVAATNVTSNGNNVLTTSSTIDGGTY